MIWPCLSREGIWCSGNGSRTARLNPNENHLRKQRPGGGPGLGVEETVGWASSPGFLSPVEPTTENDGRCFQGVLDFGKAVL